VSTPDVLPEGWARLHPLSPIVRAGSTAVALVTIVAANGVVAHRPPLADAVVVAIVVVVGTVYWLVTRWRVFGGELQIDTGLIRRQQIRVPLRRIQGIDTVRPLLARMFGMSELRLVLAGHDTGRVRLSYLSEDRAAAVRAQLLALAHGLSDDTPEPPEHTIATVSNSYIVAGNLLRIEFAVGQVLLAALIVALILYPHGAFAFVGPLFPVLVGVVLVTVRHILGEWDFHIAEAPDGIRIRSGLLQTRAETIPYGRVQAVRWLEPLWWRPFGWVRLEIDVARRRSGNRGERESATISAALLPVGSKEQARLLLARVFPGAVAELPPANAVPRRALWRAPLARRFARMTHDERYVACGTGRLRPDVVVVPLEKVQSVRWSQGPWVRRLKLANIHLDTAGHRFTGHARYRDAGEAAELIATLPDLARAARDRTAVR
jgi:putative membrane protein